MTILSSTMTPEAKGLLSKTVRSLRAQLLTDLRESLERAYRLSIPADKAKLSQAAARKRKRLEDWIAERERAERSGKKVAKPKKGEPSLRDRLLDEVIQEAGYTLLNRLVYLRILEGTGLREETLVAKGWRSQAYLDFRDLAGALTEVEDDETEGYAFLLQLVFDELATELPGLFGDVGLTSLVPVAPATLRAVIEALADEALQSCWTDDTCLGWVYQYWNDPQREALDEKVKERGKIEPYEVASKTQMFTDSYMAQWLLQNSLGQLWLAICKKQGWEAQVQESGVLDRLEARRAEWRAKREAGEVAADALMPIGASGGGSGGPEDELEEHWKYWVPQPLPADAPAHAPESLREFKLLDPACGSGHFLVLALDLLVPLYREEASLRGESWGDAQILAWILEDNLHGIDIDPRAVQIAAAALMLKARRILAASGSGHFGDSGYSGDSGHVGHVGHSGLGEARSDSGSGAMGELGNGLVVRRMQLVAPALHLASLDATDPALEELTTAIERDTGLAPALTEKLVGALRGAEHLGTLLKIDDAIASVLREHGDRLRKITGQRELFDADAGRETKLKIDASEAAKLIAEHLDRFLAAHSGSEDLGLRLAGQQLATGVRFSQMLREGQYDIVVANPPYQGTSKMADAKYIAKHYPRGKADLFAAFLERGLQLCKPGGVSAMLTMRNWMFLKQYSALRMHLLESFDLRLLGDFDRGAFESIPDEVVSVTVSMFRRVKSESTKSVAMQPTPLDDTTRDAGRTPRKRAATLCQAARFEFEPKAFAVIPESPLVYWWSAEELREYAAAPKLGDVAPVKFGMNTGNNSRFITLPWEVRLSSVMRSVEQREMTDWHPIVQGAQGRVWIEPLLRIIRAAHKFLELKVTVEHKFGPAGVHWKICNEDAYYNPGVAFATIGANFSARLHRFPSAIETAGSSIYGDGTLSMLCIINRSSTKRMISDLNPTVNYTVGDLLRVSVPSVGSVQETYQRIEEAFADHESHREPSVEFKSPGPSPWRHAQEWAQLAVDRPEGAPLPEYVEELDPEPPTDHLSFALGVALGRFGQDGEGILDPSNPEHQGLIEKALPAGILFLDGSLDDPEHEDSGDSLAHPATAFLRETWEEFKSEIADKLDLSSYLRTKFFGDVHKKMYENRPIHWPLSSAKKNYVAWVNIHRMNASTLRTLLADHLHPTLGRQEGELEDLRAAKSSGDAKQKRQAEKRYATLDKLHEELKDFIAAVTQCAEQGPPPPDAATPKREVDAPYDPDLDDGVMINAAALWPLLDPQWKDPKKWWKELATAKGRKDYDWAHLAKRYFPTRVDAKCKEDPSLGVAHGCFWKYHPERAYAWELRLQEEIKPEFTIDEADSDARRKAFLKAQPEKAAEIQEKETARRAKKAKKAAGGDTGEDEGEEQEEMEFEEGEE